MKSEAIDLTELSASRPWHFRFSIGRDSIQVASRIHCSMAESASAEDVIDEFYRGSDDEAVKLISRLPMGFDVNAPVEIEEYNDEQDTNFIERYNLLEEAVEYSHVGSVRLLLSMGATVSPAAARSSVHHPQVLKLILMSGVEITEKMVFHAACFNHESLVILIEAGANVNLRRSTDGSTLLYFACASCKYEAVEVLLDSGAKVIEHDGKYHISPLVSYGCSHDDELRIVTRLIRAGAKVMPFHLASAQRNYKGSLVDLFLSLGIELPPPTQVELWRAGRHPRQLARGVLITENMPDELIDLVLQYVVVSL